MANAKQCDRCLEFYLPYDGIPINESITDPIFMYNSIMLESSKRTGTGMDLCPGCMGKLIKFLLGVEPSENKVNEERKGDI